jgi:hypothetical protein
MMGYLEKRDYHNSWDTVFITVERGFLSYFDKMLTTKPLKYPFGNRLHRRTLLTGANLLTSENSLMVLTLRDPIDKLTQWIRVSCPGLKASVRPFPNISAEPTSFIKNGEEFEVFLKSFNGFFCFVDGRVITYNLSIYHYTLNFFSNKYRDMSIKKQKV